jgi:hypothetical protein
LTLLDCCREVEPASENTGIYHNPKRQQGIDPNTGETQNRNPSLTFRLGRVTSPQLQKNRAQASIDEWVIRDDAACLSVVQLLVCFGASAKAELPWDLGKADRSCGCDLQNAGTQAGCLAKVF